tara:strand:+ start:4231 stop:4983 length:753 start_codon:yes stop_codon:yes gene_type:complete
MEHTEQFDTNNYEYNVNSNKGVYIIHGFTSTTYETKDLAKFLADNGFHTKTNNLPGHGTSIDDCNSTKYQEWLEFVEKDFAEMLSENDNIYIVGISMGGALALHLASLFPVNKIVVCATVLHFKDHKKLTWLNPYTKYVYKSVAKNKRFDKKIRNQLKFNGYNHYPLVALDEYFKMAKIIKNELKKVSASILILYSTKDLTSPKINVDIVYNNITSTNKSIKSYNNCSHAMLVKGEDQKLIFSDILEFLE